MHHLAGGDVADVLGLDKVQRAGLGGHHIGPVKLPGGMDLRNGPWLPFPDDELILRPNGTASSTGILTIRNRTGRERLLYITAATGHAKKLWEYESFHAE